jgi:hypothetical protein
MSKAKNPNHMDNINPYRWKKGQSGNPGGRPKKIPAIEKLLADVLSENVNGIEAAEAVLRTIIDKALKGDMRAAEIILDRAYGKAKQNIELNQDGLTIKVVRDGTSYKPKGIAPGSGDGPEPGEEI